MNDDFSQPIPQGGVGAKDLENNRIAAIANQLEGLCTVYEAQSRDSRQHVNRLGTSSGWAPSAIKVTVAANDTGADRQAIVTINAVDSSKKSIVIIKQSK